MKIDMFWVVFNLWITVGAFMAPPNIDTAMWLCRKINGSALVRFVVLSVLVLVLIPLWPMYFVYRWKRKSITSKA